MEARADETSGELECADKECAEKVWTEDTPAVACARRREVLWLQEVLLQRTKQCALIQREPGNALARFLFSGLLQRPETGALRDALLPSHDFLDASVCAELEKTGASEESVRGVCLALCAASREAGGRMAAVRARNNLGEVFLVQLDGQYRLMWQNESAAISAPHMYTLRRLYKAHTPQDVDGSAFTQRLFCALMRYEAIGGPTYQCSVSCVVFAALEAEFGAVKECFASPFNHNAEVYWTAFPDTDRFFGSEGSFFEALDSPLVREGGFFYANPPFVEEHIALLRDCVQKVLEQPVPVTFAVVLPTWTDTACYAWLQGSTYTRMHLVLPAGEHEYVDGRQQAHTASWRKRSVAKFSSSCFVLQNEAGAAARPVDDATRRRVLASFACSAVSGV
jgi:phosphorylated CTD-interacting factor 1